MSDQSVLQAANEAKVALAEFRGEGLNKRSQFFKTLSQLLLTSEKEIIAANQLDLQQAEKDGLSSAMVDRLTLNPARIAALADSVLQIDLFPDPLDQSEGRRLANGLILQKVQVGIGVVGFIYESRPNVTIDAVALCLKSGNAVVLKGGKEAIQSNNILESICRKALKETGLPDGLVRMLDCSKRSVVDELVKLEGLIDVVIPRGGPGLIKHVSEQSLVPVIKHDAGNCHIYVHETANLDGAIDIILNAKTQRPGVCNAVESLVIDQSILPEFLPKLVEKLKSKGVECRLCTESHALLPDNPQASEEDYGEEYLDLIVSIKSVKNIDEAIAHIGQYSSGHTEAILTKDLDSSRKFTSQVDSSVVLTNASTRFSDGGEFGLGAEIGISTNRLHARGPMGAAQLTTYKYVVMGEGQIRG